MTAGTHLAGAALTAAVARGFGLDVGPLESLALAWGALMPDVDTTTSGPGRFVRPLSSWLERRFGHRTLTHSLPFLLALALALYPLYRTSPGAYFAFLWGYLSHLLLDTLNTNGVPLLWPWRVQFWLFASRDLRIPYGSPQEATLALFLALAGFALWPVSARGFDTAFRHLVASPETAVVDYLKWRDHRAVYVELSGFNRETQEDITGRFRVVEALGRTGVLIEDELGRTLAVSRYGQVVAYRVRAFPGEPATVRVYRLDLGGRLLGDLLAALPRQARRVWITGELELATEPPPVVAPAGTYPRVRRAEGNRLVLHAARPEDLSPLAATFVRAGSAVLRAEFAPGEEAGLALPDLRPPSVHPVVIPRLPSLAGLLVKPGDRVLEGEPLARYVDDAPLEDLRARSSAKREEARAVREERRRLDEAHARERARLSRVLERAEEALARTRYLVEAGAEPRLSLQRAEEALERARAALEEEALRYSSKAAALEERRRALELEAARLERKRERAASDQLVRSPVAGRVAEVRVREVGPEGVTVEVVVVGESEQAGSSPGELARGVQ